MANYTTVSKDHHKNKRWLRYDSFAFAVNTSFVHIVLQELTHAGQAFPLAFIKQDDTFHLIALLGLEPTQNLFIAPNGQWIGDYVPAALRGYPFKLVKAEDDQLVLCVDQDTELVTGGPHGEAFLDDSGSPSAALRQVLNFLQQLEANRQITAKACEALVRHNLVVPWPITLKTPQGEQNIGGLHQIDEQALNRLPGEALAELRDAGALATAYCQLFSMTNLNALSKLADTHAQFVTQQTQPIQASIQFDEDIIKFQ